jgi:hypothetical protein
MIDYFIGKSDGKMDEPALKQFVKLDDFDFMQSMKAWSTHPDTILSTLCNCILDRKLLKIKLQTEPINRDVMQQKLRDTCQKLNISEQEGGYFVFAGELVNTMYKTKDEQIRILYRDGQVKNISEVDNALIHTTLSSPVKKFYICFYE